jgi:hypothetical protein
MTVGAAPLRANIEKLVASFTVVFWLSHLSWVLGNYAYAAVMAPADVRMEAEPLLPIEKKLIAWSLILGLALLAILVWTGNSSLPIGR